MPGPSLLDLTVRELLDAVAARTSAPGGGSVAALTAALAAGLAGMAARYGPEALVPVAEQADALRDRAAALADADAAAYAAFLAVRQLPAEDLRRRAAVTGAAAVPAEIAEVGDAVSELALDLRHRGNPNLHGDVVAALLLASAATTAATTLVRENVGDDPRTARAAALAAAAQDRAARAI